MIMDREELNSKLLEAAEKGDTDKIWELIEQGADINAQNEDGMTALMYAARYGHLTPELLETLVSHGADVNARDNKGRTALMLSALHGHLTPELLEALVSIGADVNAQDKDGMTALIWSAQDSNFTPELLKTFISHGADINAQDENGNTALIESALRGFLTPELLGAFISHGADIHARDEYGCTALIWSARRGHLTQELARAFVEQFIRLGTPLEEIQKQLPASKETPTILVYVLLEKIETEPWIVVDFMKKHVGKKLQEWVDNGVEGADILVSRLSHQIRQKEFMSEGSGTQNMDFF